MPWQPRRTLVETDALLTAPGNIHELQTTLVDGRLYRVYKNLWPSLREFWLAAVAQYAGHKYIVYGDCHLTYLQVHIRATKVAGLFRSVYGIKNGDRVAICSRNCPDYLVVFWACHLIGVVAVLPNAWLPLEPLSHCFVHTQCKLVILDTERAELIQPNLEKLRQNTEIEAFLVLDDQNRNNHCQGLLSLDQSLRQYHADGKEAISSISTINPEDNATIIFTSGTTGLPKGVLSTQRQFLTNVLNILVGGFRAALRNGDDFPTAQSSGPQKAVLVAVPLFHVTGLTSFSVGAYLLKPEFHHLYCWPAIKMMATMAGMKIVITKKWDVEEAVKLIKQENVAVAGGVPSMVTDLTLSTLVGHPLEGLLFGGSPAPDSLVARARIAFPTATMLQGYGLTETNSIAVSIAGQDYIARPTSTGRACPVNEIQIVHENICVPPGAVGEVWLRGPNVMKCYWRDPEATDAVLTKDGWLRTGDIGYLDHEGFLHVKDRIKDIIIRGGENVDSVTVENALYADPRVLEAAAVGVPDERLGELVVALVSVRPDYKGQVTEAMLLTQARNRLPRFAVPVMILVLNTSFERTPSGKIVKGELRKIARKQWELRRQNDPSNARPERLGNL